MFYIYGEQAKVYMCIQIGEVLLCTYYVNDLYTFREFCSSLIYYYCNTYIQWWYYVTNNNLQFLKHLACKKLCDTVIDIYVLLLNLANNSGSELKLDILILGINIDTETIIMFLKVIVLCSK